MAGKIIADTIETGAGADIPTSYVVNGSAKAWVNFNGLNTPAARASNNTSTITDNGTGNYSVAIVNHFATANYAVSVSASSAGMSNTDTMVNPYVWATHSTSIGTNNNSGTAVDRTYVNFTIHGDLA